MVATPPGGGGSLGVHPNALRSAGERARQVSQAVGQLVAGVPAACAPAASAHPGWRLAQALARVIPRWESHFTGRRQRYTRPGGS